ncbi:MAG: hypothetical protein ACOX0M_10415 [Salinivirgaceae bacterium]|jgi:hypothetical protein|nr:hypothetical protein [Bacteroidales bacterium]
MKNLSFKKILLIPFLVTGMFALLFISCEKDDNDGGSSGVKSLAVTVNFTGSVTPEVGDELTVFVFNSKISELDFDSISGPDIYVCLTLTQSDIDNGVTVNLDTIDLNKPHIYIGALVDINNDGGPSQGDLAEFYENVTLMDAFSNVAQPKNCHGLSSVVINLDEVITMPSLDVTVNFTGTKIPSVGEELFVVLVYAPFLEVDMENDGPDGLLSHTLTAGDITNGITLTFTDLDPFAAEIYIAAFVDSDGDGSPGKGELIECYQDVSAAALLSGAANATNVAGETAITINLDEVLEGSSLAVTVNFTGSTKPSVGSKLNVVIFYYPLSGIDIEIEGPDVVLSHFLTADDITNGKTLTFTDLDPFADEIYVAAFADLYDDGEGPVEGDLVEVYQDVDVAAALSGEANATNVVGETAIIINLDLVFHMP